MQFDEMSKEEFIFALIKMLSSHQLIFIAYLLDDE